MNVCMKRCRWLGGILLAVLGWIGSGSSIANADGIIGVKLNRGENSLFDKSPEGAKIIEVLPGSPADKAGLLLGMIIVKVNDHSIRSASDFIDTVRTYNPGDTIQCVARDGKVVHAYEITLVHPATRFFRHVPTEQEQDAMQEIEDKSGKTRYDGRRAGTPLVEVTFSAYKLTDRTLERISYLPFLERLIIDGETPGYTGDGWRHVKNLKSLKSITLNFNTTQRGDVNSAMLDALSECPQLTTLTLYQGKLGTESSLALSKLTQLKHLSLQDSDFDDDKMAHLSSLVQLESLNLRGTNVTGVGLSHLATLKNLKQLDLAGLPVQDADLVHLKDLNQMRELNLSGTAVTSLGLAHLDAMSALESIHLVETGEREVIRDGSPGGPFGVIMRYKPRSTAVPPDKTITAAGLDRLLSAHPSLMHIDVRGPAIEPSELRDLARRFPKATIVTTGKTVAPDQE